MQGQRRARQTSSMCRRRCTSSTTDVGLTNLSDVSQKLFRSTMAGLAVNIQRSSSARRLAAKSSMTTSAWLSRPCRPPAGQSRQGAAPWGSVR